MMRRARQALAEVGLELSQGSLTLAILRRGQLEQVASVELAPSTETLPSTLASLVAQHRLTQRQVVIALSGEMLLTPLTLPAMPKEEYQRAVELELHRELGLNLGTLELGIATLRTYKDPQGTEQTESLAGTLPCERAATIASAVQQAGLRPVALIPSVLSLVHLVQHAQQLPAKAFIWLDVGMTHTTMALVQERTLIGLDELTLGYRSLLDQLLQPIQDKTGTVQLTEPEARQLLTQHGIPTSLTEERWLDKITPLLTIVALKPQLNRLTNEIKHAFGYVTTKIPGLRLSTAILSGPGASVMNLDHYLSEELNIECQQAHALNLIRMAPGLSEPRAAMSQGALAAGAALTPAGEELNLLPLEFRMKRVERFEWVSLEIAAVVAIGLVISAQGAVTLQLRQMEQARQARQTRLEQMRPVNELVANVEQRRQVYQRLTQGRLPVSEVMQEIGMAIPEEVWIEVLQFDRQLRLVMFRGRVLGKPERGPETVLSEFFNTLNTSPFFGKTKLTSFQQENEAPYLANFEATAQIAP